ncbi:ATP-binding protein [Streptomyces sp. MBT62]|uniref:ATP-binding protein n=1 Tax=Streptomyces sp. MBT62 TaxID=2800410 RepID=UPI00190A398A|nr:ATP-binding protein [Streptomyces sp. MBT62]MBK3563634.1 ATP-binding protein [Streptomyces sp. MBT62]
MSAEQVVRPVDSLRIEGTWEWLCRAVDEVGRPAPGQTITLVPAAGDGGNPALCSVLVVPPMPQSAHVARDFTRAALADRAGDELVDDMAVTVSELVSNALRYGRAPNSPVVQQPSLWLAVWDRLPYAVCAVTDDSDRIPVEGHPDEFAESGRGLQVVSALSDSWGWNLRAGGGKTVWALFRI